MADPGDASRVSPGVTARRMVTREIAELELTEMAGRDVPTATEQLRTVVSQAATATGTIIDECEGLEQAFAGTPYEAVATRVASRIYEACSFQDITGQRVVKVVETLCRLEARLLALLPGRCRTDVMASAEIRRTPLLDGPQPPGRGLNQAAIDALLAAME